MLIVENIDDLQRTINSWRESHQTIALVPTMGALHHGHLSLIDTARSCASRVVVSVFVNPKQFGPTEDYLSYPRQRSEDLIFLANTRVDAVWIPSAATMYPDDFSVSVLETKLSQHLCGLTRPGHFSGVTLVVLKLFNQIQPTIALFGEKDFQQLRIVERMTTNLDLTIAIKRVATVREPDGLAVSSRNKYLTTDQRQIAPKLYAMLLNSAQNITNGKNIAGVLRHGTAHLLRSGFTSIDYFDLCDADTLDSLKRHDREARLMIATRLGNTRLIDNIALPITN